MWQQGLTNRKQAKLLPASSGMKASFEHPQEAEDAKQKKRIDSLTVQAHLCCLLEAAAALATHHLRLLGAKLAEEGALLCHTAIARRRTSNVPAG